MKTRTEMNRKNITGLAALFMGTILLTAFTTTKMHQYMDELTVKRINIVEDDGTIRMVISNKAQQHPGRMDGKDADPRERHAGLIFFNDEGDECGGLIYGVSENKGTKSNGMSITFDQYKNDQVLQILNAETIRNGKINPFRGFMINSYPEGSTYSKFKEAMDEAEKIKDKNERNARIEEIYEMYGSIPALLMGRSGEGNHGLYINDEKGMPKLMIYVDKEGKPRIQTLNENGETVDLI